MFEFKMPMLGADMDQGILLEWKIAEGDSVSKGDIIASVETAKGVIDIETFVDGVVTELMVEPNSEVLVGSVMAMFQVENDSELAADKAATGSSIDANAPAQRNSKPTATKRTASAPMIAVRTSSSVTRVSPRARRLAREFNVDLANISGTGPSGSIVAEDIRFVSDSSPRAEKSSKAANKKSLMRRAIATAMSRAKREIPHYYLAHEIDVTEALAFLENWNKPHAITERILPAALFYKAIAVAANEFDSINGHFIDEQFATSRSVNLGIAISLRGGGLVSPCLKDAANKPLVDLMAELKDLVQRARTGGLKASELSDGTLTVSNLGDRGVNFIAGVIYPPQVALVGIGNVQEKPSVVGEEIVIRQIVNFSLSADHRVSDGHTGALFLRRVENFVIHPEDLM